MQIIDVAGKTFRFSFDDGPVAGKSFDHEFGKDGKVKWRCTSSPDAGDDDYRCEVVNEDVVAVSYLARSGFALTTVLDFASHKLVSFASNEKQLVTQHGHFEEV